MTHEERVYAVMNVLRDGTLSGSDKFGCLLEQFREVEREAQNESRRGCHCQSCGVEYREDVTLPDKLWNAIRPEGKPPGAGLLCGQCIGREIGDLVRIQYEANEALGAELKQAEADADSAERRYQEVGEQWEMAERRREAAEAKVCDVVRAGDALRKQHYLSIKDCEAWDAATKGISRD